MDLPVDRALKGELALSDLTERDQEAYLDRLEELQLQSSKLENEFFASRRQRQVGVGLDDDDKLVFERDAAKR
ncbi:MAG: hypothetical protein ABW190_03565 [Rhizobacter sp.]